MFTSRAARPVETIVATAPPGCELSSPPSSLWLR
jgi:hypothetical protein